MKPGLLLTCAVAIGMGAACIRAQTPTPDPERYGKYPTNYKEIVMKWLDTQLIDSGSARIEWNEDPKPANAGSQEKPLYGYLVKFRVNARNRFGTYTGMQTHGALIRNGEVVKGMGFGY
jgi:hypothetical protein